MVKKLLRIFTVMSLVLVLQPQNVIGLSDSQLKLFSSGIYYFDSASGSDVCSTVSSETGSGPLFGLEFPDVADPNELVKRIDSLIATYPTSPFIGMGDRFVAAGQKYNINPAVVVAIARKEEGLGTADQPVNNDNHNSFGATGITGYATVKGFVYFDSFEASIDPITKYLSDVYVHASPSSPHFATNVLELMKNGYTPGSNYKQATDITLDGMHKILDGIAETDNPDIKTTSFTPGTTGDSRCQSTNGYQTGANGYDLDKMAHFYQCDPRWADKPYGDGGNICATGCGITSMTMVVDTLKGLSLTPDQMATKYGRFHTTDGTAWSLWPTAASDYGLNYQDIGSDFAKAASIIRQGGLIIIPVNNSGGNYFTTGSHLMVIRAVDDQNNFYLANSSNKHEDQSYSADFLKNHGFEGDLFAFTK